MMANVSYCGELHNKLWKLSDIDKLFGRVPLLYDVLIDVPELIMHSRLPILLRKVSLLCRSTIERLRICRSVM